VYNNTARTLTLLRRNDAKWRMAGWLRWDETASTESSYISIRR